MYIFNNPMLSICIMWNTDYTLCLQYQGCKSRGDGGYIPPQYLTSIPPIILILPIAQHAPIFFSNGSNGKDFGGRNMQGGGNFLGIKEFEQEMGKKGWRAKKTSSKNVVGMSRKTWVWVYQKNSPKQEILKSSPPPISKRSPKYADQPPNAGHGFAAMYSIQCAFYWKALSSSKINFLIISFKIPFLIV